MKKILKNLADSLISRDQMKSIKGGCGGGPCTLRCYNQDETLLGTIDCISSCTDGDQDCRNMYPSFSFASCSCY